MGKFPYRGFYADFCLVILLIITDNRQAEIKILKFKTVLTV